MPPDDPRVLRVGGVSFRAPDGFEDAGDYVFAEADRDHRWQISVEILSDEIPTPEAYLEDRAEEFVFQVGDAAEVGSIERVVVGGVQGLQQDYRAAMGRTRIRATTVVLPQDGDQVLDITQTVGGSAVDERLLDQVLATIRLDGIPVRDPPPNLVWRRAGRVSIALPPEVRSPSTVQLRSAEDDELVVSVDPRWAASGLGELLARDSEYGEELLDLDRSELEMEAVQGSYASYIWHDRMAAIPSREARFKAVLESVGAGRVVVEGTTVPERASALRSAALDLIASFGAS